jgi:hypothetical protein
LTILLLALKILGNHYQNILWKSPCYPIIGMHNKYRVPFYYCKLHPNIENIYLESIEHHCKFSEPGFHKSEILKSLKEILLNYTAKKQQEGERVGDLN